MEPTPHPATRGNGRGDRYSGLVLGLLCLAQFLVVLDTSIVNVALPAIGAELGFSSQAGLQYVISLYALTFGGLLIVAGRVGDLLGRRRLFIAGLLVFALTSAVSGLAPTPAVLLAARAGQGIGSAMISSAALALLTSLFPEGQARHRALGAWGAVGGAAGASGLLLGGALTDLVGWPWIFFINVPLGLVAAWAAPRLLPDGLTPQRAGGLDLPGAITVTASLGLLIFGLTRGETHGFTAVWTVGLLAGALALLAAYVLIERRTLHPLVAPRLVRVPGLAAADGAALVLTTIIASNLFFTTLYVQQVLGFTPLQTGLAFLPNSVLVVAGSAAATRLAHHIGPGPIVTAGFLILLVAGLLLRGVSADGGYLTDVLPGFALTGLGLGLGFVAVTHGATRGVDARDHGLASGLVNSAQQVGFAVGIAAIVTAALALSGTDIHTAGPEQAVAAYSIGYLLDATLAVLGLFAGLVLTHTHRRSGSAPTPEPATKGAHQ